LFLFVLYFFLFCFFRFSSYFARIGCEGRVFLTEGEKYGIDIKVSFRKNVPLQTLSASSQSGGEKSVSTMLYLLCLQDVTGSPFRMVDEINQGMDAVNEKVVFDQIVRSCESIETVQEPVSRHISSASSLSAAPSSSRSLSSSSRIRGGDDSEDEDEPTRNTVNGKRFPPQ
jgi:hypothetical protein